MWQHRKERHRDLKWILTPGSVLLTALLLSGCSSVPDAANPMEWYKGAADWVSGDTPDGGARPDKSVPKGDFPKVSSVPEAPRPTSPADRKDLVEGLVSDRANAKYTEDVVRREATGRPAPRVAPAAKPAPAPAPQSAAPAPVAPKAAAAPVTPVPVAAAPLAPPPPAAPAPEKKAVAEKAAAVGQAATRSARAEAEPVPMPSTEAPPPPPSMRAVPAAAAPVKAAPPVSAAAPETTQDAYQRRLAESAEQRVSSIQPVAPAPSHAAPPGEGVTLIPPSQGKAAAAGASFQVAAITFPSGSAELSVIDRNVLKDVVKLQRQNGGKLRVIGHSGGVGQADTAAAGDQVSQMMAGFDMSMKRANAVSKELMRQGVPGKAIFVSAQSAPAPAGSGNTEIFIEY